MLLANVVLVAQLVGNTPARQVSRPCADASALCKISPFFCPGTYPQGMEPCWPEGSRQPREVSGRVSANTGSAAAHSASPRSASSSRASAPARPRPAKLADLDR